MTARRVRPFGDADYTAYARIAKLHSPLRGDAAVIRAEDAKRDPRYERVRMVAVDEEDAPIGYGEIYHEPKRFDPRRYFLDLAVDTTMRRRGIGGAIWDRLLIEIVARRAEVIALWAGDATACQAFITKRGFSEVVRAYTEVLAVASAPLPTRAAEERVAAAGIGVTTLAAFRSAFGDDALEAVWDLHSACRLEHTALGRATPLRFEDWRDRNVTDDAALPDACFLASDGERLVGLSAAYRASDDTMGIEITGVLPAYRRRGIGQLLKLRLHAWARSHGIREIHTTATSANRAMLALNDALGYAIVGSVGGYELRP